MTTELIKTPPAATSCPSGLPADTSAILRIFGRNTLWLWLDLGALRIGTMLAGLFLIRYFGPLNFGIYSSAIAFGWVANAVIDLGLTRYAARAVVATPDEARPILSLSLLSTVASALVTLAFLWIALRSGHAQLACIAAGFILCNLEGTSSLCSSMLTAELRSKDILPGSILGACGLISLTFLTIWLHLTVLELLVGLAIKCLLVLTLRLWQLRSSWPTAIHWSLAQLKGVAGRAWEFFANNLTQVGYGRVAILSLGAVAPQAQVGWFAAAYTISDVIPQWSYALSGALLPVWTRLFESGRTEEMLALRRRLLDGILLATIPIWICLASFARPLCSLLGPEYVPSAAVLQIVAVRSVLSVLDGFLGHGFLVAANQVCERQRALARCLVLLAAMSLAFGYLWGAVGVGLALLISDGCLILQYLWINSRIGLKIEWPSMAPSLAAILLMVACVWLLPDEFHFTLRALASIAVYFFALFVFSKDRLLDLGQTLRECMAR